MTMKTSRVARTQIARRFWLWWLMATVVGTVIGMAVAFIGLASLLSRSPQVVYGVTVGTTFGTIVGLSQWLVLRNYVDGAGWWVLLTLVAWVAFWQFELSGLLAGLLGLNSGIAFVPDTLHLAVFGFLLGVSQWLLLRQRIHGAGWWVPASVTGAMLGAVVADAVNYLLRTDSPLDFLTGSIVWAVSTGACMVWLLRRPASVAIGIGRE